jgi:hypothetical protein
LKKKKTGAKKEEKEDAVAEPAKEEDDPEATEKFPTLEDTNGEDGKGAEGDTTKDAEETVSALPSSSSHHRAPSVSQQSKMRSSSFRQSSGGLPSPGYGFPTDGDTAPDIYRKQAVKIDELEKENKRLAKEAADGEKRWKKAEEELEDLREAQDESSPKGTDRASESSRELEKLVCNCHSIALLYANRQPENRSRCVAASKYPITSTINTTTWLLSLYVSNGPSRTRGCPAI